MTSGQRSAPSEPTAAATTESMDFVPPAPLPGKQQRPAAAHRLSLTLVSFGFKYGRPPANHYFDVSFLKNPAREEGWGLWSTPSEEMRQWVLEQREATEFLDAAVPLATFLARADDDARLALGCSAGRHRSTILTEELAVRLRAAGVEVTVHHRERDFA